MNEPIPTDPFSWRMRDLFPEGRDKDDIHEDIVDAVADALVARYLEEHPC